MADEGWIKLYRKITNSFVWTNSDQLKLWILVLTKANHTQNKFLFNGQEIRVTSGQFVTGAHALASEFNQGVPSDKAVVWRTLWRWLKKFEKEEMLTISSNARYSVITVSKWGEYQSGDKPLTSHGQSDDKPLSTNKNDKNDKNITTTTTGKSDHDQIEKQQDSKTAVGYWLNKINQAETQIVLEQIQSYVEDLGDEVVILAINMMAVNGARSFAYAKAILNGWLNHTPPLTTITEITNYERQRKQKKSATNKSKPKTNNVYKERELTEEDLKWPKPKE